MTTVAPPQVETLQSYVNAQLRNGYANSAILTPRRPDLVTPEPNPRISRSVTSSEGVLYNNNTRNGHFSNTAVQLGIGASRAAERNQPGTQPQPGQLIRANTDILPTPTTRLASMEEGNWELRHGFEDQYASHQYLELLNSVSFGLLAAAQPISQQVLIFGRPFRSLGFLHVLYRQASRDRR